MWRTDRLVRCQRATLIASPPHHLHLPSTTRPCHQLRSPSNSAKISSTSRTTDPQGIRAQRRSDPPQSHQNHISSTSTPHGTRGHFGLTQSIPTTGFSAARSPLLHRMMPNVARRVARPRSKHTAIKRLRLIGRIGAGQNSSGT